MTDTRYDRFERRCPRLGGTVAFGYCRECADGGGICPKAADCWWEYFDIVSFLKEQLEPSQFEAFMQSAQSAPKPKVVSLMELIRQARTAAEKQKG